MERNCDACCSAEPALPKCWHTGVFQEEPGSFRSCDDVPLGDECFGTTIKPKTC